jgi:hypothetical protein
MRGLDAWLAREPVHYIDPHNPWAKVVEYDGSATVQYGHGEDENAVIVCYGKGPDAEEHADRAVFKLNAVHPDTHCVNERGFCTVCGDFIMDLHDGEVAKLVPRGDGRWRIEHEYLPLD